MRIKEICRTKGITTKELADKVGTTLSNIYNIDNEKANPTLNMLKNISVALGVHISELFDNGSDREEIILIYKNELKKFNSTKELEEFINTMK